MTATATAKELTKTSLQIVFGVSDMSVWHWTRDGGTPTKTQLEAPFTPTRVAAWAKKNGVTIIKDPARVLELQNKGKGSGRPSSAKKPALKRSASGKLSGVHATASSGRSKKAAK